MNFESLKISSLLSRMNPRTVDDFNYWHLNVIDQLLSVLKPEVSVEVGVAEGQGTQVISRHSSRVFAIDMDLEAKINISKLKNVTFIHRDSWSALEAFSETLANKVDFLFIDGDHRAEIAYGDFSRAQALLSARGIIALHDTYPGDSSFVSEENEWCGSAYLVPEMIRKNFPEFDCVTLPIHPGLTLVQRRIKKPIWMN